MTETHQPARRVPRDPTDSGASIALQIATELPYLRRYARALTGTQASGDGHAAATLEAILAERSLLDPDLGPRLALFRAFHRVWTGSVTPPGGALPAAASCAAERAAQARLSTLTPQTREALLLRTVEEFRIEEVAVIMGVDREEAEALVATALREMAEGVRGQVLLIEDEPLIAMDIAAIVEDLGHQVTGIARTLREALRLGSAAAPDLILADIQLADNSSGIDAVNGLLSRLGDVPVVFIKIGRAHV